MASRCPRGAGVAATSPRDRHRVCCANVVIRRGSAQARYWQGARVMDRRRGKLTAILGGRSRNRLVPPAMEGSVE